MNIDWLSVDFHIRLIGVLSFVFIAYSFWFLEPKPKPLQLPNKHNNPVLAFSLAKTGDEIDKVKKDHADFVGIQLKKDWGYIAVYLILFLLLSLLLVRLSAPTGKWLGWVAATAAVLAAIFDLVENTGMSKALANPIGSTDDTLATIIRYSSMSKWTAFYLFTFSAGLFLFTRSGLLILTGVLMLAAAVIGITGIIVNLFNQEFHFTFRVAPFILGLAVSLIVALFTFFSGYVFENFPAYPRDIL